MTNETTLPELPDWAAIVRHVYDPYIETKVLLARLPNGTTFFTGYQMRAYAQQATADLRAELEQCRADADRYKWLQQNYAIGDGYVYVDEALNNGEADTQLSAAIDAARGAK